MRRCDRVYAALAGASLGDAAGMPTWGMSPEQIKATYPRLRTLVDADASHPTMPGAPAGTTTEVTREILAAASALLGGPMPTLGDEAEEGSGSRLAGSRYVLRAIAAGITTSTDDPDTFAETVWKACANEAITRQEFQAAALVAAAISLGLDSPQSRPMDVPPVLWKAVSLVAGLPPRGTWHPGPDVVVATRTAVSIADNYKYDVYERLNAQIGTSADPAQSVPAAFAIVSLFANWFAPFGAASLGGDTSVIAAIAGSIVGAIRGSSALSVHGIDTVDAVFHLSNDRPLRTQSLAQTPPLRSRLAPRALLTPLSRHVRPCSNPRTHPYRWLVPGERYRRAASLSWDRSSSNTVWQPRCSPGRTGSRGRMTKACTLAESSLPCSPRAAWGLRRSPSARSVTAPGPRPSNTR